MGILDDAIRDHLDLKRRGGAEEGELKELEDEAFGPPGRPQAPGMEKAVADAAAPEAPPRESHGETGELADAARNGNEGAVADDSLGVEPAFHDFAAEEGLIGTSEPQPELEAPPGEAPPVEESPGEDPPSEEPGDEPPVEAPSAEPEAEPVQEPPAKLEDTQVHDMESELGLDAEPGEGEGGAEAAGDGEPVGEIELEELDLELADEDEEPEAADEQTSGEDVSGEDVLEETPDFLRDTPESDRLWFEQGKPKDFDFDDEEK